MNVPATRIHPTITKLQLFNIQEFIDWILDNKYSDFENSNNQEFNYLQVNKSP